jgi:hypothetical protein
VNQVPNVKQHWRAVCKNALFCAAAISSCLLSTRHAAAEVKIGEADGWEAYVSGQVNTFLTYAFGDAYPVAPIDPATGMPVDRLIVAGGGLSGGRIPEVDANGDPIPGRQGTVAQWRVRTGFSPQSIGFGVRKEVTPELNLKAQLSIWGTIEPPGQQKYASINADFREGWGAVEAPWGTVTLGRHLGLFSRGIVEMDFLYAHQYGVGYHGSLTGRGPAAGLIGFGVLAAFFSPGIMYTTPKLAGLQLNLGVYDSVQIPGSWETARTPRPEFELTYDIETEDVFAKAFVNGAYQKLYGIANADISETMVGIGGGARVEVGPIHLGAGGHYGRGLGLYYALEGGDTSVGPTEVNAGQDPNELRTFDGFSAFAQYAPGQFDINLAAGQSRVHLLETDKTGPDAASNSVMKTQTGISAGFVWHFSKSFHWDVDYMRAMFRWYKGDKQDVNFVNTGVTLNW